MRLSLPLPFRRTASALLGIGLFCALPSSLWAALKLSKTTPPEVVVAAKAFPAERYAAEELAHYLGRILGCEIAIRESASGKEVPIYVGHRPENASLEPEKLAIEASLVVVQEKGIHIVGGRSKEKQSEHPELPLHDRGTLYGVYELLEELGVRWYRPEPWGEHVPAKEEIVLKEGERRAQPVYRYRYGIRHYQTYAALESQLDDPAAQEQVRSERKMARRWAVRNRQNCSLWTGPEQGGYHTIDFAHAYGHLIPHTFYFKTHPEYFARVNGKRSSDPNAQLCLSNPEVEDLVFRKIVQRFEKQPDLEIASLDPNDYAIWCECDPCRALDDPKLKASHSGSMPAKIKGVSMSNRVVWFNNRIARRLRKVLPDKKVGWYAYMMHTEVPTKIKHLEPNTAVMPVAFAGSFSDYSRGLYDPASRQNATFLEILKGYHSLTKAGGAPMLVHDYWSFYVWPGPLPVIHSMSDKLRAYYRDFDVAGVYNEVHPCWGPQGMVLYFYTWLLRHPEGDLAAEKRYYYQSFYGPAAKPMERYHERLEKAAWGGPYFGSGGMGLDALFTNELLDELKPLIEEALALAANDKTMALRVEGVAAGYHYARKVRDFYNLIDTLRPKEAAAKLTELEAYFGSFKDGSVFDNRASQRGNFSGIFKRYHKHLEREGALHAYFTQPEVAQRHDKGFRFRIDPKRDGEAHGWHGTTMDDTGWAKLVAGQAWQAQGFPDHQGTAWYRKHLTGPGIKEGHRLVLYFGAVDGDATIYINGQKVGEHLLDPATQAGYDEPFFFDVTDMVKPAQPVQLAIRVEKNQYVGGLTHPVLLIEVASIRPPE